MQKINEIIVVEGKHDSANLQRFFPVRTFVTNGRNISKTKLDQLKELAKKHTLIIFTDPDSSGNYIREVIATALDNCLHAYLAADDCRNGKKVGIEYASKEELAVALDNLISYSESNGELTASDLNDLGLNGNAKAQNRRKLITKHWHLGDCNAKSLLKRLNALGIKAHQIQEVLAGD